MKKQKKIKMKKAPVSKYLKKGSTQCEDISTDLSSNTDACGQDFTFVLMEWGNHSLFWGIKII